jgi:hypothetical protein
MSLGPVFCSWRYSDSVATEADEVVGGDWCANGRQARVAPASRSCANRQSSCRSGNEPRAGNVFLALAGLTISQSRGRAVFISATASKFSGSNMGRTFCTHSPDQDRPLQSSRGVNEQISAPPDVDSLHCGIERTQVKYPELKIHRH